MMRCSECSRPVLPVVAIDIDGTLGDYHGHFINFAEIYLNKLGNANTFAIYDGTTSFKEWGCYIWGIDEATWSQIKLAYRQGGMKRSMPNYPGATDLCRSVRNAGAELWLTTTRPFLRLDNIDPDTRFWLEQYGIEYDGLLYDDNKYHRLAELVDSVRVVAVLDDLPEQRDAAASAFNRKVPILRRNQFNRGVPGEGLHDLREAATTILSRIDTWKRAHG